MKTFINRSLVILTLFALWGLLLYAFGCGRDDKDREACVVLGEHCHEEKEPTVVQGPKGEVGPQGKTVIGPKGESCSVQPAVNGALITCGETQTVLLNGVDGNDAPPTPYTVTEMIDPCGKQGTYDEVLLRLADNSLIAHYASGANQFLTVIDTGNYATTDGTNCHFNIDGNLAVTWQEIK